MKLLLDTHVLIWALYQPERLSVPAANVLATPSNTVHFSPISLFEIETKHRLGKWPLPIPQSWGPALNEADFLEMAISTDHAILAGRLAGSHRDSWDRLLAAQSLASEATLVTADPELAKLGATVLW